MRETPDTSWDAEMQRREVGFCSSHVRTRELTLTEHPVGQELTYTPIHSLRRTGGTQRTPGLTEGPGPPVSRCRAGEKPSESPPAPSPPHGQGCRRWGLHPWPRHRPGKQPQITLSCVVVPWKYPVQTAFGV